MNLKIIEFDNLLGRSFTILSPEEQKKVISYRNHADIRKWMYNSDIITFEEHLKFVESLKNTKEHFYWLVENKKNHQYLGVIYIKNINRKTKEAWYGIYVNPSHKVKGTGTLLSKFELYVIFYILELKKVFLSVKSTNVKAIKLYEKLGFESDYTDNDNYLFMHLKFKNYAFRK